MSLHETTENTRPKPSPLLREWTQHPQRITDAIYEVLAGIPLSELATPGVPSLVKLTLIAPRERASSN